MSSSAFDLERFVVAQEDCFETAMAEVAAGKKESHWMWFIYPQLRGLGSSATSIRFGIHNAEEAQAYLEHPLLGPRLSQACEYLLSHTQKTAREIFGSPDDDKLRSCATLFASVSPPDSVFHRVLERYFQGLPDAKTLQLLTQN